MAIEFKFTLGTDYKRIADAVKRGFKPKDLTSRIANDMKTEVQLRFRMARGPEGEPWPKTMRGGYRKHGNG
jgi:phage gpG-like protein